MLLPPPCVELLTSSGVFPNHKASSYSCTNVVPTQLSPLVLYPFRCINRMDLPLFFFCLVFVLRCFLSSLHPDTWCCSQEGWRRGGENDRLTVPPLSSKVMLAWYRFEESGWKTGCGVGPQCCGVVKKSRQLLESWYYKTWSFKKVRSTHRITLSRVVLVLLEF